jgi:hypothetical protein
MKAAFGGKWEAWRSALKIEKARTGESWSDMGKRIGVLGNTLVSFVLGRSKGLSEETVRKLLAVGISPKEDKPMDNWNGEVRSVKAAAQEKGRCMGTIRKWCHSGKVNYVRQGRRLFVVVDTLYNSITPSAAANLQRRVEELEAQCLSLREQVERHQLVMPFCTPELYRITSLPDWSLSPAPEEDGRWLAQHKNGTVSTAHLHLPLEIVVDLRFNHKDRTVAVPEALAERLGS